MRTENAMTIPDGNFMGVFFLYYWGDTIQCTRNSTGRDAEYLGVGQVNHRTSYNEFSSKSPYKRLTGGSDPEYEYRDTSPDVDTIELPTTFDF